MPSKLILWMFLLCVISIIFSFCLFLNSSRRQSEADNEFFMKKFPKVTKENEVFILSKANIGQYLWHHIFNATSYFIKYKLWQIGDVDYDGISYKFYAGPGLIQTTAPKHIERMVLVLNGRTEAKVVSSKLWLDYLAKFRKLRKVGVILLGNEGCDNSWILPYMESNGGRLAFVFLVYDSPLVNNDDIFQWPLGIADYRGFPKVNPSDIDISSKRPFVCNFLGTLYKNSSRKVLYNILKNSPFRNKLFLKGRDEWTTGETEDSMKNYIYGLKSSDFTLSPVGMNSECYRIYEAMSFGSTPVVENVVTPGQCTRDENSPLRLLKMNGAPIVYIDSWNSILEVIKNQLNLSHKEMVEQRRKVINWYSNFKVSMKHQLHSVVKSKFSIFNQ